MPRTEGARSPKVIVRYPSMVQGFMQGKTMDEIGAEFGVTKHAIWHNLRTPEFQQYLAELLGDVADNWWMMVTELWNSEDEANRRACLRYVTQMFSILYPKKVDVTTKSFRYELTEDRKTFRENFGKLSPEEQAQYIELWRKMSQSGSNPPDQETPPV